jgi:hypothetical protein
VSTEISSQEPRHQLPRVAVLVPCYNEELSIAQVVTEFRTALPEALIYVYDNDSQDRTREIAARSGAVVRREPQRGKGNVVCRMFADVDADIYVLVDGDATYDAASAPSMIAKLRDEQLDMVAGRRINGDRQDAYRRGHAVGNVALTRTVAWLFGEGLRDMLTGYRVFSRRFVKSFPSLTRQFEIETELTVHALALRMPVAELDTPYRARVPGSASKLHTFRDGSRIVLKIIQLLKDERPLPFFSALALLLAVTAIGLAWPVVGTFLETGLVPRFPTAMLATGIMLLAFLCLTCGLILDTVTRGRKEARRLAYLALGTTISAAPDA